MSYFPDEYAWLYVPDALLAGEGLGIVTESAVIGEDLERGALLGRVTATGKYVLSLAAATDGSQTPRAILAIDAAADETSVIYLSGAFNAAAMTFGAGHSANDLLKDALRRKRIFIRSNASADEIPGEFLFLDGFHVLISGQPVNFS